MPACLEESGFGSRRTRRLPWAAAAFLALSAVPAPSRMTAAGGPLPGDGSPTPAHIAPVSVPESGGTTLLNRADGLVLTGNDRHEGNPGAGDQFGAALASGDFTGDGLSDLAVGAPGSAAGGQAASGLVDPFQGSGGSLTEGRIYQQVLQADGGGVSETGDGFGAALAAGDFDGNGQKDLAVGAPGQSVNGAAGAGIVFTYRAGFEIFTGSGPLAQEQAGGTSVAGDGFGSVLAAGDFNGDGFDDLAIGAPAKNPGGAPAGGVVYVFRGSASGFSPGTAMTLASLGSSNAAGDQFGAALASGDFNSDGFDDLAIGAPGRASGGAAGSGLVAVLLGSATGLHLPAFLTQESAGQTSEAQDHFGAALATGDVDGDGRADLAVGAPGQDVSGVADSGLACLLRGTAGGSLAAAGCVTEAAALTPEPGAAFGSSLALGDLDGDGHDDLAAGAPGSAGGGIAGAGSVFVFRGGAAGALTFTDRLIQEDVGGVSGVGDHLGARLASGDFDGDGADDLAASAPADNTAGPASGSVWVVPGLRVAAGITQGPILGAVSASSAIVWGRADRAAALAAEWKPQGAPWPGTVTAAMALAPDTDLTGAVTITGLQPSTAYAYRLRLDGNPIAGTEGSLRTLPASGPGRRVTFGFGADTTFGFDPYSILDHVGARQPDFMLYMGDQIYADRARNDLPLVIPATDAAYARKYRQNWSEPHYRALLRDVPSFMIWDDHDIIDDWDGGQTGRYVPARAAYDWYQGSHNPAPRVPGEVYYAFDAGDASFYVIDDRSYRSSDDAPDGPGKTMLGATQKADLEQWLSSAPGRFKFIVSPVMWNDYATTFDGAGGDAWRWYQTERGEIFDYVRSHHICGVLLLSGDQHWTGVFRNTQVAPYDLYEFSPTPLGAFLRDPTTSTNPEILCTYGQGRVYGLLTADTTVEPARVSFDAYDANDQPIAACHLALDWADVCPDSDGDTVLDDVDCAPSDPSVWAIPSEPVLQWNDPVSLAWSAAAPGGIAAPRYDLLVSPSASDFGAAASCLASDSSALATTDPISPLPGTGRFYLVRAENSCGGTLGHTSAGIERIGRACP